MTTPAGLSTAAAQAALQRFGRNEIPREHQHPLKLFLSKLWGPIPWMLEVTILLEVASRRFIEGTIVFALLLINAAISFVHENRAQDAVEALRSRLQASARVLRDGSWSVRDARDLVPGDVVHVRMGDVVPADLEVTEGSVSVDEATLTGESLPVERSAGSLLYSSSTIKRGEASAIVKATGTGTKFGLTAELVRKGDSGGHLRDRAIRVVRYLVAADGVLLVAYAIEALQRSTSPLEMLTFALTLLLGAIPIALPATFTLATALGAAQLAKQGVLVTRLSAIEDAAVMDTLCIDKTGTLTENRLTVSAVVPLPGILEEDVLRVAGLASDAATQDPLDLAVLEECKRRNVTLDAAVRVQVRPFDPERKYAETIFSAGIKGTHKAAKGSRTAIASLSGTSVDAGTPHRLAAEGQRVLTIAEDNGGGYKVLGFVAFSDPLREDAADLINRVRAAGIRVMMLTGDTLGTAHAIAEQLGLSDVIVAADDVRRDPSLIESAAVVARVLPEDKYAIVRRLQQGGHACGMTGDGVNDAPALQAAQVGIAVNGATDAAKAAASLVLTRPGLVEILPAIEESRRIFHRLSIYTTNKVTKSLEIGLVLTIAALAATIVPLTPLLMIFLLFGNDFATMAISADNVSFSRVPVRWSSRATLTHGLAFALPLSALSLAAFFVAIDVLKVSVLQTQTMMFLLFVCSSQALIYVLRERGGFWRSVPSKALVSASLIDVSISTALAVSGTLMAAISPTLAAEIMGIVLMYITVLGVVFPVTSALRKRTTQDILGLQEHVAHRREIAGMLSAV